MSKRIIVSLGFCTLLSACALNPPPVAAQAASDPAPAIQNTPISTSQPGVLSPVAVLQPSPVPLEQREDAEPESELKAEEAAPVETVATPPQLPPCPASDGALQNRIAEQICQRVRIEPLPTTVKVENRELRAQYLIPFYAQRDYQAAWLSADGKPRSAVDDLLKALGEADREGLQPADYHRAELQKLLKSLEQGEAGSTAGQLADADLRFTDAYLTYASHLLSGRLSPRKVDPEWAIPPRSRDLAEVAAEPGKNATHDKTVTQALRSFQHRHGLAETGKVNAATLAALNVPVSERRR